MKYVLVILDGMADRPLRTLGGQTPLGFLCLPHLALVAGGQKGYAVTTPKGMRPGSETAISTILGCPLPKGAGRAALEALGENIALKENESVLRANLVSVSMDGKLASFNGGGIAPKDALRLFDDLFEEKNVRAILRESSITPHALRRFYCLLTGERLPMRAFPRPHEHIGQHWAEHQRITAALSPGIAALEIAAQEAFAHHPINIRRIRLGLLPANALWCWGTAKAFACPKFSDAFHKSGAVITGTPLVRGLARAVQLNAPDLPFATGGLDTSYAQKAEAALNALRSQDDFVLLHVEAPDLASHMMDVNEKLNALRRIDAELIKPLLTGLEALGDFRLLVMPDHATLVENGQHDAAPVPFALLDSRFPVSPTPYHEHMAGNQAPISGLQMMPLLFERSADNPSPA